MGNPDTMEQLLRQVIARQPQYHHAYNALGYSLADRNIRLDEAQALIAKSYQLGESDLPARLRADNERFDADLALARARSDVQRAIARLNQSLGLLP